jgi:HK97 family phage portal protein
MRLGPYDIIIKKAVPPNLSSVDSRGGWWPIVREPFSGAWQENEEEDVETVLAFSAAFACLTLICSDVSKMRLRLVEQDANTIWNEVESASFSPFLRKPNRYQNRIQFVYWWLASKLIHGNTYALKARDARGVVRAAYILDPTRTRPLVAPDGSVYYELKTDNLSGLKTDITVPAAEIFHDVGYALFHPLVGVSPIYACGLAAVQGLRIQNNSSRFFANGSKPGGVLTAPGTITPETAQRVKTYWDENFVGDNMGKVAVLGDGLKYEAMAVTANDSQLIEQLKWTAENVCTAFHVPAYKVGIGNPPSYNNVEALDQQYYSQCLQFHIESMELVLDEGLGLSPDKVEGRRLGVEFDLEDLLRMDSATQIKAEKDAAGIKTINESRQRLNLKPMTGGDQVYLQHQDHSIEALAKRDEGPDPFASASKTSAPTPEPMKPANADDMPEDMAKMVTAVMTKAAEIARRNAA